jgi:hypothetical protein
MLHLFNNQLGFSKEVLGFPSVDSCNAIVYQTAQGLCGLHNYGGDSPFQFAARAAAFTSFVQECNIAHNTHGKHLYSVVNKRYDPDVARYRSDWIGEMKAFAESPRFHGSVHLIKLRKHLDGGPVYIQYMLDPNGEDCSIGYKKYSKMEERRTGEKDENPANLFELKKNMDVWNSSMGKQLDYDKAPPTEVVKSVKFKSDASSLQWATPSNVWRMTFTC